MTATNFNANVVHQQYTNLPGWIKWGQHPSFAPFQCASVTWRLDTNSSKRQNTSSNGGDRGSNPDVLIEVNCGISQTPCTSPKNVLGWAGVNIRPREQRSLLRVSPTLGVVARREMKSHSWVWLRRMQVTSEKQILRLFQWEAGKTTHRFGSPPGFPSISLWTDMSMVRRGVS